MTEDRAGAPYLSRGIPVMASGLTGASEPSAEDDAASEPDEVKALDRLAGARPGPGESELTVEQLEALLFVAERPLGRREIGTLAGVDGETVDARLGDLEVALRDRGIRLVATGEQVELATAPEAGALIARYVGADEVRLSPAALETLAIVAYRQPVTRGAVERIRGVDSDYVVRSLLHRRLIVEQGRAATPGRPILYGTGFDFLERFGLTSLDDLPPLETEVAARLATDDEPVDQAEATALTDPAADRPADA
ncbi:MAG: SMC-Scp complex subunit ScpB [Candidatus Limnocylindrales bacterium]